MQQYPLHEIDTAGAGAAAHPGAHRKSEWGTTPKGTGAPGYSADRTGGSCDERAVAGRATRPMPREPPSRREFLPVRGRRCARGTGEAMISG
ncbi:hypothetical protein RAJCM14343_1371 [Rhodococcus aetherivorans]|uniref:Uncharacterized protein n=1 Tax=Rhodococcus aetherivorans TaxID=191292 RepID=A0ABQ0YI11_9NOCA|nr:hypothetical protein RAJCM14343_1371 [Rhodococcus aetherivorans]CCW14841.1 hypothetical protein EBESD8_54120 [Rhodococcus aetherivorans]